MTDQPDEERIGPFRVRTVDWLPDDTLIAYLPPAPGTRPGDPDWVPLERRHVKVTGIGRGEEQT